MDSPVVSIWERQAGETGKAYAAFCVYRDQGPSSRSLRSTCEAFYNGTTSNLTQIAEWSRKYDWVFRVDAYDAEQDRINRLKRQEDAEEARQRAKSGAHLLQSIALKALHEVNQGRLLASGERVPEHNPNATILRYYREGVELEFLALGIPISVIRQEVEEPTALELESQRKAENRQRALGTLWGGGK